MKKYVVCKGYRLFRPDVVEQFDDPEDAQQYAALMEKHILVRSMLCMNESNTN